MPNIFIGKTYSKSVIKDIINNPSVGDAIELIGFVIRVIDFDPNSEGTKTEIETDRVGANPKDIELKPLYMEVNKDCFNDNLLVDCFDFSTGESISENQLAGRLIAIDNTSIAGTVARERPAAGERATEIEFYDNSLLYRPFDFAYLALTDMKLLLDFSDEIIISGAEINNGLPNIQPIESGTYFSFKIEGPIPGDIIGRPLSVNAFPQMLFASPCPPYWKNPVSKDVVEKVLDRNIKNFSGISSEDPYQLLFALNNKWKAFATGTDDVYRKG